MLSEPTGGIDVFQADPDCPSGWFRILHGVLDFPGSYGRDDPYKGKVFGYLDDIDSLDITTVELNEFDYETTDNVKVAATGEWYLKLLNHSAQIVSSFLRSLSMHKIPNLTLHERPYSYRIR